MSSEIEYAVVMNDEEQYSIWPTFKDIPLGWQNVGKTGTKEECLDYIEEVWTDITPKSVREAIAAAREEKSSA